MDLLRALGSESLNIFVSRSGTDNEEFCIAKRTSHRERADSILPWLLSPLFVVGLNAKTMSRHWPAHKNWFEWTAYAACAALSLYITETLIRVAREPVNYRSLRLSDSGLEYLPLWNEQLVIEWKEIERVVFCRVEALFPDPGPYLETKWLIKRRGSDKIHEVMDEWGNRAPMFKAMCKHLPGFDGGQARQGFRARGEGKWVCFNDR